MTRFGRAVHGRGLRGSRPPRLADRPRPRPAPRAGGGPAHPGAARLRLRLPGGGARPPRGGGPARGGAPGPDLGALGPHRPGPRRVPRAAPVGGRPPAVRLHAGRRRAWLPQPPSWAALTAAAQVADPGSTWSLYRAALRLRRRLRGDAALTWLAVRRRRPGVRPRAVVPLRREPLGRTGGPRRPGPGAARQRRRATAVSRPTPPPGSRTEGADRGRGGPAVAGGRGYRRRR